MFLEFVTFLMLILILALKYSAVTRIARLNQRLREAEGRCRRYGERLKLQRSERRIAEREEAALIRKQAALGAEAEKMEADLMVLMKTNEEAFMQLNRKKGTLMN